MPRATRFLRLLLVLGSVSGCYTIQTAQNEDLPPLRVTHDDHIALLGPRAGTRVDPTSPIRFHAFDGSQSDWLSPSLLQVNQSGVFTTSQPLSIDELARIEVRGLLDERRAQLASLAEGLLVHDEVDRFEVSGPGAALLAWAEAARAAGRALPEEDWGFYWRGSDPMREMHFGGLAFQRVLSLPTAFVDGLQWSDIASLEVQHPDYGSVLVALIVVPIALAGGNLGVSTLFFGGDEVNLPVVNELDKARPHLWKPGRVMPDVTNAQPLFSPLAQRRAAFRPIAALEVGTALSGQSSALSFFGGIRVRDFFETGLGVHLWWPNLFSPSRSLSAEPLGPAVSKFDPTVFTTLRLGFNFDLDADRRLLVPLHFEVGIDFRGHVQTRMSWGLQVRITERLFIALRPFSPQFTTGGFGISVWQFPSTLELGAAF